MSVKPLRNWKKELVNQLLAARWSPLLRAYYRLRPPVDPSVAHILACYAQQKTKVCFVQVGAHSGGVRDPLYRHIVLDQWEGILVEPQVEAFRQLQHFYQGIGGLRFLQLALSDQEGMRSWFHIEEQGTQTEWASQLAGFEAKVPTGVLDRLPGATVREVLMPCTTLTQLLTAEGWTDLDVLLIDAEGHDAAILAGLDWQRYQPDLVIYEHCHLSASAQARADELLSGYRQWRGAFNTVASMWKDLWI